MATDEGDNLRQAVFGANDGLVSTFGLVAGLVGAAASQNILIIANVINMFAAGMSMGFGTYLATKSEVDYNRRLLEEERKKIRSQHSKAEAELLFLLRQKGVPVKQLKAHMREVMHSEESWIDFVMWEKHGLGRASFPNPVKGGAIMFSVFVLCGLIPIMPLFFAKGMPALLVSAFVTAIALFIVGALKQQFTGQRWWRLGFENLIIGAITGTVGFIAGVYVARLVGPGIIA